MFRRGFKTGSEETAFKLRRKLGLEPHAAIDPMAAAASLGVPVANPGELSELPFDIRNRLLSNHSGAWSAITVSHGNNFLIVINSTHPPARINSSLAHEIAHVILAHEPSMMFMTPKTGLALRTHSKEQEDEANWLAGCILLPREALLRVRRLGWSDEKVCLEYGVSQAMLRFRVNATGVDLQMRRTRGRF
jgi:hypothetical protein